ncbi:hypothetical protein [Pseudoalteromonas piscicida]|uniref:hypothetical protein n=1 Tax=Pseudoalteromonas piscicida TaxID=43662 RepID=UPI0030B68B26
MKLNKPCENNFPNVDYIGVALRRYGGNQNHIAILFKPNELEDEIMLLHVGSHKGDLLEEPSNKYLWIDLGKAFHPIRKQVILASIQQIAEKNSKSKVRYGLDHGVYCLDPETGMLNENYDQKIGFTCATFVVEVFLSVGIKLIDWDTWPSSGEKHIEFQKKVFSYLESEHAKDSNNVTVEYLKAQSKNIGKARFLPEEIAAATQEIKESTKLEVEPLAAYINEGLTYYSEYLMQQR